MTDKDEKRPIPELTSEHAEVEMTKSESTKPETTLKRPSYSNPYGRYNLLVVFVVTYCLTYVGFGYHFYGPHTLWFHSTRILPSFKYLAKYNCQVEPLPPSEFYHRQERLSEILQYQAHPQSTSYILEPGANAGYFANVSLASWRRSERPLLVVLSPLPNNKLSIRVLTPKFESSRAKAVFRIPSEASVEFIEWAEDEDPYSVLARAVGPERVIVDDDMRQFVVEGLRGAGFRIATQRHALSAIRQLRERKTEKEIEIMKCANELTLVALKDVRDRMWIGMTESQARSIIGKALLGAGLGKDGGGIFTTVQFGKSAGLPHGGGEDRTLTKSDLITFDLGGSLHGYWSDVTRTFALPGSTIPSSHLEIWFTVARAQKAAFNAVKKGARGSDIDAAARRVIEAAGKGKYFTHRLGHGIGMELHESPYLRGGNDVPLASGNTFSDEPGIYIEGELGIRLEDCFVVDENGKARLLTEGVGGAAKTPWLP
ncbi:hypothetical protein FRC03_011237 [Tulasnella sp. 419]|nr:hypothetical protein FRC03_011237 [Tulasnella sp. 419]